MYLLTRHTYTFTNRFLNATLNIVVKNASKEANDTTDDIAFNELSFLTRTPGEWDCDEIVSEAVYVSV